MGRAGRGRPTSIATTAWSTYNFHNDGSGICYSSRLRPIMTMRSALPDVSSMRAARACATTRRTLTSSTGSRRWARGRRRDRRGPARRGAGASGALQGRAHAGPPGVPIARDPGCALRLRRPRRAPDVPGRQRLLLARRAPVRTCRAPSRSGAARAASAPGRPEPGEYYNALRRLVRRPLAAQWPAAAAARRRRVHRRRRCSRELVPPGARRRRSARRVDPRGRQPRRHRRLWTLGRRRRRVRARPRRPPAGHAAERHRGRVVRGPQPRALQARPGGLAHRRHRRGPASRSRSSSAPT